jgi:UPF0755 protein
MKYWNHKIKFIAFGLIGFIFILFGGGFAYHHYRGGAPGDGSITYDLIVEPGMNPTRVSEILKEESLIKSKEYFQILVKLTSSASKIKMGVYSINNGQSSWAILQTLIQGKVKMVSFTIPEGYTNRQIADVLFSKGIAPSKEKFLEVASDKKIIDQYKIPANSLEGYLFPETYTIPVGYPLEKVVLMMVKRFYSILSKVPESKGKDPKSLHDTIILASIVEREAVRKEERPLMAGVFSRRLQIGMRLESCATVQYLFEKPKKRLLERDLKIESPYNTYLNSGFPPGPISNPGLPAIQAAFKPVISDKLFFLLKPDGSHYFSSTVSEHLEAKKKYIDVLYQK